MKKGLFLLVLLLFVFINAFAGEFYPDPDPDNYTLVGIDGLGVSPFIKIRKDVFEAAAIAGVNERIGVINVEDIEFEVDIPGTSNKANLHIKNMELEIGVDYLLLDRDGGRYDSGKGYSLIFGFNIKNIKKINLSGDFYTYLSSVLNVKKDEMVTYFQNYFNHFGIININAEMEMQHENQGVYSMNGFTMNEITINGWRFYEDGRLLSNGMNGVEIDENIHLFAKIGKMIAANIFVSIGENEDIKASFGPIRGETHCSALNFSDYCNINDFEEAGCFDSEGYFLEENSNCSALLECEVLPAECGTYYSSYTAQVLPERKSSYNSSKNDAIYLMGDMWIRTSGKVISKKLVSRKTVDGEEKETTHKDGLFLKSSNLTYDHYESGTTLLTKEKLKEMASGNLIEINIPEQTLAKITSLSVREIINEIPNDYNLYMTSYPFIKIVNHVWNNNSDSGNLIKISLALKGNKGDLNFDLDMDLYLQPQIEKGSVVFNLVDKEIRVDADLPWVFRALSLLFGDILTNLFTPTLHNLSVAISSSIIHSIANSIVNSYIDDTASGLIDDNFNSLDGLDLEELADNLLLGDFGSREYEYGVVLRNVILNERDKDSGIIISIGLKNSPEYPLESKFWKYWNLFNWDEDVDGIKNIMDNCRGRYNPYQSDEDGDGIGSMCDGGPRNSFVWIPIKDKDASLGSPIHDFDYDGVANITDNCPGEYNTFVEAPKNDELISGVCDGALSSDLYGIQSCYSPIEGGAVYNILTNKFLFTEKGKCFDGEIHYWQPDADLDGIGDKCDHKDGLTVMGSSVPYLMAGYYSLDMSTELKYAQDGKKECIGFQYSTCIIPVIMNKYVDVTVRMNTMPVEVEPDPDGDSEISDAVPVPNNNKENLTQKFCWVDKIRMGSWGDDGFCTTTEGKGMRVIPAEKKYLPVYGYSHGSDPAPADASGNPNWKDPNWENEGVKTQKCKENCVFTWDWRENLKSEYFDLYEGYVTSVDEDGENGSKDSFISYVFSSGVQSGDSQYMTGTGADKQINPNHFKNSRMYARSKRDTFGGADISYYRSQIIEQHPFNFGWFDIGSYLERYGISPWWWMTGPGMPFEYDNIDIYKYVDGGVSVIDKNITAANVAGTMESIHVGKDSLTGIFNLNDNSNTKVLMTTRDKDSAWSVGAIVEMPRMSGTVNKVFELVPGQQFLMMDNMAVYKFDSFYGTDDINQPMMRVCNYRIQAEEIARLPFDGAFAEIVKLDGRVLIINKNASSVELYELDSVNGMVVPLSYDNAPSGRGHMNLEVIDSTLYLAGGAMINGTQILPLSDVYRFSFENGWETVTRDTGLNLMGAVIAKDGDSLKIYSRPFSNTGKINVAVIDENTGITEIQSETIEGGAVIEEKYCIDDSGINVYPGIETQHICQKIDSENYEYSDYTFFDYKMSLAGYENNLYIGGLTGVRRMEIRNDGSLKMKDFILAGSISSLATKDDRLFGAAGDSIKVFKLENDGSMKFDRSVKAPGCKDIRISGNYLYAGMNGKVAVYDVSNNGMVIIKNIAVDNNVEDLEISNGYLYVYHEKGFWFWKKTVLTKFDIRNINAPVKTGNKNMECSDAEMMTDSSNVYLGCENGQFRINKEIPGLSVETVKGKKNYFRDSYINDGIIYTVHSGRVFMSR